MAERSVPWDDQIVDEAAWSELFRHALNSAGVVGNPGGNEVQVFANSTGRQVFVTAGRAVMRGALYVNDAQKTIALSPNTSGTFRNDLVVLRQDPALNAVTAIAKEGTPGQAAPGAVVSDTGTFEVPLAVVNLPNNYATVAASQVSDVRRFSGLDVIPGTEGTWPGSPRVGQPLFEADTGRFGVYTGAAFGRRYLTDDRPYATYTPSINQVGSVLVSANSGRWKVLGGRTVHVRVRARVDGVPTALVAGRIWFSLPFPAITGEEVLGTYELRLKGTVDKFYSGVCVGFPDGGLSAAGLRPSQYDVPPDAGNEYWLGHGTRGFRLTTGTLLSANLTYEIG